MSREITVIGAGNLGANIAYFLSEWAIDRDIHLYDSLDGRARGKTLDMIEAQPIRRALPRLHGTGSLDRVYNSAIAIVAISDDMLGDVGGDQNALQTKFHTEMEKIANDLQGYRGVLVYASPYEEECLPLFEKQSGIDAKNLIGLGTLPHTMRSIHLLSRKTGIDPRQIQLVIVGQAKNPFIVKETTRIAAIPLDKLYPDIDIDDLLVSELQELTRNTKNHYYSLAAAATRVAQAVACDLHRVLPVASMVAAAHYGTTPQPFAMPSVVSAQGVSIDSVVGAKSLNVSCNEAASIVKKGRK